MGFLRQLVHDDEPIIIKLRHILGWEEMAGENVTFPWRGAKEDRWECWDRFEWVFGHRAAVEGMLERSNEGHSIRSNSRISFRERAISLFCEGVEGLCIFGQDS